MTARDRSRIASTAVVVLACAVPVLPIVGSGPALATPGEAARLVTVEPCRLIDTRLTGGRLPAGATLDLAVAGERCSVPDDATAAAITITAVKPSDAGFLTVWPAGSPRPDTSVVNARPGEHVPNSQLVRLGAGGRVSLATSAESDLLVDVMGYFVPVGGPVAAGRLVPIEPSRLVDTRTSGRPPAGGVVTVYPDVPDDAIAVAVNIGTADSSGPGYFTAYAAGTTRPTASVLNTDAAGQTRSTAAIVPLGADGFSVYTSLGDHVIVDITGYFTGGSAAASLDGLFVSVDPVRLLDTRRDRGASGGPRLWDGGSREFAVTGITGGPVSALAANVTMTATEDAGYVVAGPARVPVGTTASVNADAAQRTVANAAIIGVSTAGVRFDALESTHLVVDVTGWFTGTPLAASTGPAVNVPPPDRRVFVIADSTMAGIRWNGALAGLQGFAVVTDLESCRRLVAPSCRGREGYTPPTLVAEIRALPAITGEDILVIGAGYDDWYGRFASDFDAVVATARAKGFHHIAWATYVVSNTYTQPGSLAPNYTAMNAVMAQKVASGAYPEVRVWDLDRYTASSFGWFYADGIHETRLGSWGVADWISRHVRAFDDRPCPQPWAPGQAVADPCPDPDALPATLGYPDVVGLYGL